MTTPEKPADKITQAQLQSVINLQLTLLARYHDYREGQAFFNALAELYPDVANGIRASEYDPFYKDNRINDCIKHITL